ncbi:phage adaptor protein [Bradyrhizobium elkanii]|uniref:phage adaptor protein n=1 Tax=Bradyrhizobium elkanii TaxID=29448 RepID=UPI00271493C6|nr:hypothetical protein [Bradyrhizobium elkanii]WLA50742.1 hypothetical protein QIH80_11505 [Bradyrhizobium elkanii]WLB79021.1 hypothetical protein QIH83_32515 [Bradyrhizobium elkanii]
MSILSVLQTAMPLCGLPAAAQAVSAVDPNTAKFVAMAQDIGDELRERYFWRNLNIAAQLTGDGTTTLFQLPPDWAQLSPGQQIYSSVNTLSPLYGPITNEQLAALKSSQVAPVRPVWRIVGSTFEIWPALGAGEIVTFNYYSSNWVSNAAGTQRQPNFLLDSDFSMIDELVLRRGLIYRWKESKGLECSADQARYERALDRAAGREDSERITSTAAPVLDVDGWWPGTVTFVGPV